ncbi:MAG: TIGR01620 family protein [Hyphomicrobiaceae bacterium]
MTEPVNPRRPRVFSTTDPHLVVPPEPITVTPPPEDDAVDQAGVHGKRARVFLPTAAGVSKGVRFGAIFVAALVSLATLAASISFMRFVSVALARDDWLGWTAAGLLALAALSGLVLLGREVMGLLRLARLGRLRRDMDAALAAKDKLAEREGLVRLKALYAARPEMRWPLARLAEHERDIHDPGSLLALADRELMAPLDTQARALVLRSAKRVSTVTALSPLALIAVGYVLIENVGLLRRLAGIYGGRPGAIGSLRLARLVVAHIVGTGGVALTDDLIGQFFGQDVLRRLSRRLGEGAFNGALTVRLGAAALDVIRPLPFIDAPPIRARDIVKDLFVADDGKI